MINLTDLFDDDRVDDTECECCGDLLDEDAFVWDEDVCSECKANMVAIASVDPEQVKRNLQRAADLLAAAREHTERTEEGRDT